MAKISNGLSLLVCGHLIPITARGLIDWTGRSATGGGDQSAPQERVYNRNLLSLAILAAWAIARPLISRGFPANREFYREYYFPGRLFSVAGAHADAPADALRLKALLIKIVILE